MKFKPSEIQALLYASYSKEKIDIGKFIIDKDISSTRVKTYTIPNSNEVIVTHRGSGSADDWFDNLLWLKFNTLKSSRTYKMHLGIHMKAVNKYGANNIIVMGHSRGGLYAEQLYNDKLAKQKITYNKPVNMYDIGKNVITDKQDDPDATDIRTSGDIPSLGKNLTTGNSNDIVIPSKTNNPLTEHYTEQLLNLDDNVLIGQGIFKPKINYSKIRKAELKSFVKNNKKKLKLDINISGLTKKDLVVVVDKILS